MRCPLGELFKRSDGVQVEEASGCLHGVELILGEPLEGVPGELVFFGARSGPADP